MSRSTYNRILAAFCGALLLFAFPSCLKKSEKQQPYYYSEEELDSHKEDGATVVDISDPAAVRKFLSGKHYASKTYRIDFSDSLQAVMSDNGKEVFSGKCDIGEYMINDERLLMITDTSGETFRFTLAHNGLLTDKSSYALFRPVE